NVTTTGLGDISFGAGDEVSLNGSTGATLRANGTNATDNLVKIQAWNDDVVGGANIEISADDTITMAGTTLLANFTADSELTMNANSASDQALTIQATNVGAGAGNLALNATNNVLIKGNGAGNILFDLNTNKLGTLNYLGGIDFKANANQRISLTSSGTGETNINGPTVNLGKEQVAKGYITLTGGGVGDSYQAVINGNLVNSVAFNFNLTTTATLIAAEITNAFPAYTATANGTIIEIVANTPGTADNGTVAMNIINNTGNATASTTNITGGAASGDVVIGESIATFNSTGGINFNPLSNQSIDITTLGTGDINLTSADQIAISSNNWAITNLGAATFDSLTLTNAADTSFTSGVSNGDGKTLLSSNFGYLDSGAYIIGTYDEFDNSSSTNVQGVLNDLDAAITSLGGIVSKYLSLDIAGGVRQSAAIGTLSNGLTPAIVFNNDDTSAVTYSFATPQDWASGSITVRAYWSPSNDNAGTVNFDLSASSLALGELSSLTTSTAIESGGSVLAGSMDIIHEYSKRISGVSLGDMITFKLERDPSSDSYVGDAYVHMIRLEYSAYK
ncbi:MAG: hypothetical protein OEY44_03150, partial [Candidatus Peregrinibacteria bacterium]|nr:hypothetical protein [Candidatus Peregrinibacteria bacterium]